jgi:hypothetical protein
LYLEAHKKKQIDINKQIRQINYAWICGYDFSNPSEVWIDLSGLRWKRECYPNIISHMMCQNIFSNHMVQPPVTKPQSQNVNVKTEVKPEVKEERNNVETKKESDTLPVVVCTKVTKESKWYMYHVDCFYCKRVLIFSSLDVITVNGVCHCYCKSCTGQFTMKYDPNITKDETVPQQEKRSCGYCKISSIPIKPSGYCETCDGHVKRSCDHCGILSIHIKPSGYCGHCEKRWEKK